MKTIKTFTLLASVCAAVLLAVGCKDTNEPPPVEPPPIVVPSDPIDLAGTSWKLNGVVDVQTGELTVLELGNDPYRHPQSYTLTFDTEDTYSGFSSRNDLWGNYTVDYATNVIRLTEPWATAAIEHSDGELYCNLFWNSQLSFSYQEQEGELRLYFNDGKEYFSYRPHDITKYLTVPKWKLIGIRNASGLTEFEPNDCEECYTLTFDDKTTFSTFTSSNSLTGKYEADFTTHTFRITNLEGAKLAERGHGNIYRSALENVREFWFREGELILVLNDWQSLHYKALEE